MCAKLWMILFLVQFRNKFTCSFKKDECGYKQCPLTKDGALNVHLIPHSHMDAGWVKTFDQYYYGTKQQISTANVQLIYHSVLSELLHDKNRKFTLSETAYFWRWWKEQRTSTRSVIKKLVQEGRIEFAGGGWVQNDEATADYEAIIDSYTWGLRILNDTLGPCAKPKAAWQIDTYGHSREQASLMAQMGFDGLFISRVDYKEREAMIEEDRMEFIWRGSDVLGKMTDIMTHTLFNLYNPPEGFCFDYLCNDEPIMEEPMSKSYNADKRVAEFISHIERQAKYYSHDNVVVMMGGDFTYLSAAGWFMNMDKLINHINTHPANMSDINIFYSTPSCYLKSIYLHGKRDKGLYTEKADLFPYGTDPTTHWTGYFTSRPSLKYLIRKSQQFLQILKQLSVITRQEDSYELHLLRHAVSLAHHHDAITGTSQQHVANDYARSLSEALDQASKKVSTLLAHLTPSWGGTRRPKSQLQFSVCFQLNISQCNISETSESMLLVLYNPSSVKTAGFIRLPASASAYTIKNAKNEDVEHQIVPLVPPIINLPGRDSAALQEVYFLAESVPPLGFTSFYVTRLREASRDSSKQNTIPGEDKDIANSISNEYLKVTVNKDSGLLESIQYLKGAKIKVSQNFYYYSQLQSQQHSGAYSFRPNVNEATPVTVKATFSIVKGPIVTEIRQRFSDWVTQTIRLYSGQEFIEFDWIIGPVPVGGDLGKEVITRFTTNITNRDFYTDSNGRQMIRRTCTPPDEQQKKLLAACYYPVTSRICISSNSSQLCVLTDRAQGGTSYRPGEIELMVHRRLLTDDEFGLDESLNEEAYGHGLIVRGQHRVVFGKPDHKRAASAALSWKYEPWMFMAGGEKIHKKKWGNMRNKRFSSVHSHALPPHVHILTLEPWKPGSVLLRLENTRVDNYTHESNSIVTVDLRTIFLKHTIVNVREVTMPANQWLEDARQMDWSTRYVYDGGNDDISDDDNTVDYSADTDDHSTEEVASVKRSAFKMRKSKNIHRTKRYIHFDTSEPHTEDIEIDEKSRHDILKDYIYSVLTGKKYKSSYSDLSEEMNVSKDEKALSKENARYEYQIVNDEHRALSSFEIEDINKTAGWPPADISTDLLEDKMLPSEDAVIKDEYVFLESDKKGERRSLNTNSSTLNHDSFANALQSKLVILADLVKKIKQQTHNDDQISNESLSDEANLTSIEGNVTSLDLQMSDDDSLVPSDIGINIIDPLTPHVATTTVTESSKAVEANHESTKDVTTAATAINEDLLDTDGTQHNIPLSEYKQDVYYDLYQRRVKRAHAGASMPFLITWNEENHRELKDLIDEHLSDDTDVRKLKNKVKINDDSNSYLPYLRNQSPHAADNKRKATRNSHFSFDITTETQTVAETTLDAVETDYYGTTTKMRETKLTSQRRQEYEQLYNTNPFRNYLTPDEYQKKRAKEKQKHADNEEKRDTKKKYDVFNDIEKFVSKSYSIFDANDEDDDEKPINIMKPNIQSVAKDLTGSDNDGHRHTAIDAADVVGNNQDKDSMYQNEKAEQEKKSAKYLNQSIDTNVDNYRDIDSDHDTSRYTYRHRSADRNKDKERFNEVPNTVKLDGDYADENEHKNTEKEVKITDTKDVSRDKRKNPHLFKKTDQDEEKDVVYDGHNDTDQDTDKNKGTDNFKDNDKKRYAGVRDSYKYIPSHPDRNINKEILNKTRNKEKSKRKGKLKDADRHRVKNKHSRIIDDDDKHNKLDAEKAIDEPEPTKKTRKRTGRKKNSKVRKADKKERQKRKKHKKRKKKSKKKTTTEAPTTNSLEYDLKRTSENIKLKIDKNNKAAGISLEKHDEWMDQLDVSEFGEEYSRRRRQAPSSEKVDNKPEKYMSESDQVEEYLVTLKPTQIRTFIVWFDSIRP